MIIREDFGSYCFLFVCDDLDVAMHAIDQKESIGIPVLPDKDRVLVVVGVLDASLMVTKLGLVWVGKVGFGRKHLALRVIPFFELEIVSEVFGSDFLYGLVFQDLGNFPVAVVPVELGMFQVLSDLEESITKIGIFARLFLLAEPIKVWVYPSFAEHWWFEKYKIYFEWQQNGGMSSEENKISAEENMAPCHMGTRESV